MSRWPIRLRLTAAFALAMVIVLAAAGLFVYLRVRADLNDSIATSLRARADAVEAQVRRGEEWSAAAQGSLEPEEAFAQILSPSGRLLDASGGAKEPILAARVVRGVSAEALIFDAKVEGIEETARVLVRRASPGRGSPVMAVGVSLDDRDETLASLLTAFAVGGPIAVAVASLVGYLLAAAALAPVEAMRRRATQVSLDRDDALPLPAVDDEIRRLGETLNEMLERLRSSFERERRFVADASHELRTPVAVLKTEVEAALESGSYGPEVGDSLRAALVECDGLAQLAEDLLVLTRADESGLPLGLEEISAEHLLQTVRDRFRLRAHQQGRALAAEPGDDLTLIVDPLRMRQALGNLVDNALRHGDGDIELAARREPRGVALTVSDGGPGFGPELAAEAFERFTRGDAARGRGGTGLGLAIVQRIARAHGGEAEIVAGETTVVRIRLPAERAGHT